MSNYEQLNNQGWRVLVVWECELKQLDDVVNRILTTLNDN